MRGGSQAKEITRPFRFCKTLHLKLMKILYITYDGILDPVGQSQVIPYLSGLAKKGASITLISFEKRDKWGQRNGVALQVCFLEQNGIKWVPLRYHKKPTIPATCFDILQGFLVGLFITWRDKIQIIHARSYIPSLITIFLKPLSRVKFIFDMRGLWIDERVDCELWRRQGLLYQLAKYFERKFLLNADIVVSLTENAKKEIKQYGLSDSAPLIVEVIPTCVDLTKFKSRNILTLPSEKRLGLENKFVVAYAGSLGIWYRLKEMLEFYVEARERISNIHLLVLTPYLEILKKEMKAVGLTPHEVTAISVPYHEVSYYLSQAHVGLAFYKPCYAAKGCCPTKIGEYLATGLPVIVNRGVGDSDSFVEQHGIGAVINHFNKKEYLRAMEEIMYLYNKDSNLPQHCRQSALHYFSLDRGIERYWQIYQRLL